MQIKDFINETLVNIVEGVDEANLKYPNRFKIIGIQRHNEERTDGNFVDFDISVNVEKGSSGKTGGKVGTGIINVVTGSVSAEMGENNSSQNTHRLQFKIYISENTHMSSS